MSLLLDRQYAVLLRPYTRNFTVKGDKFNFSCVICGDSQSNQSKARAYLLPKNGRLSYVCHNCNTPIHKFADLLKHVDSNLANQYTIDSFLERKEETKSQYIRRPDFVSKLDPHIIKVSALPPGHACKKYVAERQIPSNKHYLLYYTDDYNALCERTDPDYVRKTELAEPRLVIPLITEDQKIAGYQGRSLTDGSAKYLTVLYHEDNGKLFGFDRVDFNRKIYAFEGPLDALFIDNSIATAGGRIDTIISHSAIVKSRVVIVYDNEPRSQFTIKKIQQAIQLGFPVCIWPDSIVDTDINNMVKSGLTPDQIKQTIDNNTYQGLAAELALQTWRKI